MNTRLRWARRWVIALGLPVCIACASAPEHARSDARATDATAPKSELRKARFEAAAAYSEAHGGLVLLVVEGDEVVFEAAVGGHSSRTLHPLNGGSEAFWGVVAVVADEQDLLDLDEPVAFTLEEWADEPLKGEVRIRQLLRFSSGLEAGFTALKHADQNRFETSLELEMISRPAERFQYGPSHLTVFGELLRRKLAAAGYNPDPALYLEEQIFEPLGVDSVRWDRDAAGNVDLSGGAHLSARQWARFGRLLRDDGIWKKHRLLGPEAMATLREGTKSNPGFGLSIWTNPLVKPDGTRAPWMVERQSFYPEGLPDLLVAPGQGGQRLYVIPSLDLVVVRFANRSRGFRDTKLLKHIVGAALSTPPAPAASPVNVPQP